MAHVYYIFTCECVLSVACSMTLCCLVVDSLLLGMCTTVYAWQWSSVRSKDVIMCIIISCKGRECT